MRSISARAPRATRVATMAGMITAVAVFDRAIVKFATVKSVGGVLLRGEEIFGARSGSGRRCRAQRLRKPGQSARRQCPGCWRAWPRAGKPRGAGVSAACPDRRFGVAPTRQSGRGVGTPPDALSPGIRPGGAPREPWWTQRQYWITTRVLYFSVIPI